MANYSAPYGVGALNTFNERDGFLEAGKGYTPTHVVLLGSSTHSLRRPLQCCVAIGEQPLVPTLRARWNVRFFLEKLLACAIQHARRQCEAPTLDGGPRRSKCAVNTVHGIGARRA